MSDAAIWWLRSPYAYYDYRVWYVDTDGSNRDSWCYNSCGVRPALMEPCDE